MQPENSMYNMITIKQTRPEEISKLMPIFEQAKRIMRKSGNMKQWTSGYPNEELVRRDIETDIAMSASTMRRKSSVHSPSSRAKTRRMPASTKELG